MIGSVASIHRVAGNCNTRKTSFVLCSAVRSAQLIGYTGLHSSSVCSPGFLEEIFSETQKTTKA